MPGKRKIIFEHRRAAGDALMFTAGVRDFALLFPQIKINIKSSHSEFWENNPYLDQSITVKTPGVEHYRVGYPTIQACNNGYIHFTTGFLLDMLAITDLHERLPLSLGEFCSVFANGAVGDPDLGDTKKKPNVAKEPFIGIKEKYNNYFKIGDRTKKISEKFARQRADLHLSKEEKQTNTIKDEYGVEKYWLVAPGGKTDCTCKIWDWRQFQKVVDHFEGRIKFATIGMTKDKGGGKTSHIVDKLENVIDLTNKTGLRDLIRIVYHAEGGVTGVSMLAHLMAAIPQPDTRSRKPCVQIVGGREPTSYTWYCNHQVLHTNGALQCCDAGGCWQSRVVPLEKESKGENKRLCHNTVVSDGRTIARCMDMITPDDVIRAIEHYYDGGFYEYLKPKKSLGRNVGTNHTHSNMRGDLLLFNPERNEEGESTQPEPRISPTGQKTSPKIIHDKEINFLASLQSKGGGEQSAVKIVELLGADGWKVNFYPWDTVHRNFTGDFYSQCTFKNGMLNAMSMGIPLFFYANDQIWDFCKEGREIVDKSSAVIVGINWANGALPKATWMADKLKAVVFQNREKMGEWDRDAVGFENTERICLYGAISLDMYLDVPMRKRESGEPLVVLKHGMPDFRKYVTEESANNGQKIHIWQKNIHKEKDTRFYKRLLDDTKFDIKFRFMEAHPELVKHYQGDDRFDFLKFDEIPVTEFLASGHVYLHRVSNLWRDNYPRTVAEAMASGLPVLSEPRDGTLDRIQPGDTGLHLIDYDGFLYALKMLHRKEDFRYAMGVYAKQWAKDNLDPQRWVEEINRVLL